MNAVQNRSRSVRKAVGLSSLEESRLRHRLRRSACSEPWVDAQIVEFTDIVTNQRGRRRQVVSRFYAPGQFPPGGKETTMRWCRGCGRFTPRPCVNLRESRRARRGRVIQSSYVCDDCLIAEAESSPLGRELREAGILPH